MFQGRERVGGCNAILIKRGLHLQNDSYRISNLFYTTKRDIATDCMLGGQPNHGWRFAFFFNCMPVGRYSDSKMVPT